MTKLGHPSNNRKLDLPPSQGSKTLSCILLASLILIVIGAKFLLIKNYGLMVPYWDQWDAEASNLYKPYLNSDLSIVSLFSPHNEHRIFLTRILSLLLLELNGGWNPLFQMIINAFLHALSICILSTLILKIIDISQRGIFLFFTALVFALPIGFENSLSGFQSQFYFIEIFSFLAIAALVRAKAFGPLWWLGTLWSVLAYFSLASGALTVASIFLVVACQIFLRLRRGAKEMVAAAILLILAFTMICFVPHIQGHDQLGAHSLRQFLGAYFRFLAFPFGNAGVILALPMAIYGLYILRGRIELNSPHWAIMGLILWLLAQATSIAYGRAAASTSSRYLDLAIIGLPLNLGILLFALRTEFIARRVIITVAAVWLTLTTAQLMWKTSKVILPDASLHHEYSVQQELNVKKYLAGDQTALRGKPWQTIPYPQSDRLEMLLSDPTIRLFLPEGFRSNQDRSEFDKRAFLAGRTRTAFQNLTSDTLKYSYVFLSLGIGLAFLTILLTCEEACLKRVPKATDT